MKARIDIVGDAASYLRSLRQSIVGTNEFRGDLSKLAVDARTSAASQIKAAGLVDARLRKQILAYREVAAAAKRGSTEQVIAANLAAKAELRLARSLGVTAVEQKRLNVSSAAGGFARVERGALSGSGALTKFGRAGVFASNAFLGGAGLAYAITSTVRAAEDEQRVLGQTENAVKRSGLSWTAYSKQVEQAALAESNLSGFNDKALLGDFSKLVRSTHDVSKALHLDALAANVARGANIDLDSSTKLVLRANQGQARGLALIGINARKGATGVQLIGQITQKYANSAAVYGKTAAGAQDRFRVSLEHLQESVATRYLPAVADVLNQGAKWLNDSRNQARIQADVHEAVHGTAVVAKDLFVVLHAGTTVVGGLTHALELLAAVKVGAMLYGTVGRVTALETASVGATTRTAQLGNRLGQAGLVLEAGAAAFALTTLALHVTGLDKELMKAGDDAERLASKLPHIPGLKRVLDFTPLAPAADLVARALPGGDPLAQFAGKTDRGSKAGQVDGVAVSRVIKMAERLKEEGRTSGQVLDTLRQKFTALAENDLRVLAGLGERVVDAFHSAGGAAQEAGVKAAHGLALAQAALDAQASVDAATAAPKAPPLDRASSIELKLSQDQLAVARGERGAKQKMLADLKDQIDFDRKWEKAQEVLLARGIGDRKQHAKILERLQQEETQAIGQIAAINKAGRKSAADLAAQRNQWFDTAVSRSESRVADAGTAAGQLTALQAIAATIQARLAVTKDITRRQKLEDDLLSVIGQEKTARQQSAQDALDALSLGLERAQATAKLSDDVAALTAINDQLQARIRVEGKTVDLERQLFENQQQLKQVRQQAHDATQFRALGLSSTGDALTPTRKQLRTELTQVGDVVKGTFLDTGHTANVLDSIRRILNGRLGAISADVRSHIASLLDDLKGQVSAFDGFNLTAADRRRRFLDRRYADRYGGDPSGPGDVSARSRYQIAGAGPNTLARQLGLNAVKSGQATWHFHFEPHLNVIANEPIGHALDRSFFRMRVAMGAR